MRLSFNILLLAVAAAWLLGATFPSGLNVCMQSSGNSSVGLGCSCEECAAQVAELDSCSLNCCQNQPQEQALGQPCCTCTRLVLLAGQQQLRPEQPKVVDAPAPASQFTLPCRLMARQQPQKFLAPLHPPPLLHRSEILQV